VKGLSAVADERCRTDKLDGVIKHRSSRETTMVGRGASLDGRLFLGGTDGSTGSELLTFVAIDGQALRGEALLAPELGRNALPYLDGVNSEKRRVTKRVTVRTSGAEPLST
jgi:hypothetical protein